MGCMGATMLTTKISKLAYAIGPSVQSPNTSKDNERKIPSK